MPFRMQFSAAGLEGGEVEDVILVAALQQGSSGGNVARQAVLRAGLPDSVSGMTIDRQCSSGLMAIATAAKQIVDDGMQIAVGGGVESISLVQNDHMNNFRAADPWLKENKPSIYMPMLHYGRDRRRALRSDPRAAGRVRARSPSSGPQRPRTQVGSISRSSAALDQAGAGQGDG